MPAVDQYVMVCVLISQAQGESVVRVCLKERGQDVLVLQRVPSDPASPQSAGVKDDDGDKR